MKELSEMSNEELWELFPIILTEHNPEWQSLYMAEKQLLSDAAGECMLRINHIGSTSVPGLIAKPTIDILMEIKEDTDPEIFIPKIESLEYIYTEQPGNPPPHMMFMKGYTNEGFKGQAFHLHVRYYGDWDELYFCRYLCDHPDVARQYGELKLDLKNKYEHDRDAYTRAKPEFIRNITHKASDGRYL